jgi:hypothetical protein
MKIIPDKVAGRRVATAEARDEVARSIALVQPVKAAPYFAHALFSPPATVLALPDPGDAIPYVKARRPTAAGAVEVVTSTRGAARPREIDYPRTAMAAGSAWYGRRNVSNGANFDVTAALT